MNKIDKLFDNPWFIRIIALILALLLFENVLDEKKPDEQNVPPGQESEVVEDVPVKIYYDVENLVISGVPRTVTLKLTGPKNIVQQAMTQRDYEVYVDLSNAEIGRQKVPIEIREISDRITVEIDPATAIVSVQEKVTKEFSVEAEFNNGLLADGYTAKQSIIKPKNVKVTGAKDVVDNIAYVKATLDVKDPTKETFTREAEVIAFDKDLNKLDVIIEPKTVDVTVVIEANTKKVPIRIKESGSPPAGIEIESLSLNIDEATIIGKEEALAKVDYVNVDLALSDIKKDTVITLPIILPEGIVESDPAKVEVTIKVSKTESRTLTNIPIQVEGLNNEYVMSFVDSPEATLIISGESEDIQELKASDFNISIDVSGLNEGEHNVPIKVSGPDQVDWELEQSTIRIKITKEEA